MKRLSGDLYVFAVIFAIALLVIIWSSFIETQVESKVLPLVIGGFALVLAAIGLVKEARVGTSLPVAAKSEPREPATRAQSRTETVRYLLNLAWLWGLGIGIYLAGYAAAIFLFVLLYMKWLDAKWRTAIVCAIISPIVVYGVFQLALKMDLYRGLLFSWLD